VPDVAIASAVVRVRPHRSPRIPPAQQPSAPTAMTAKVAYAAGVPPEPPRAASWSEKNTRNHAYIANSSHMWPK
jgi:hypothetical protein